MASKQTVVVTRTRNRPQFLKRAAESVMRQQYQDLSWVVVNDGGERDPVDAIVGAISSECSCEVIHLESNVGMEAAGNIGMNSAAGRAAEYAAIHDDDDTWSTDFLAVMTQALASDETLAGAVCRWSEIEEEVSDGAITPKGSSKTNEAGPLTLPRLAVRNRFPPIALLFRVSAWKAAGGFAEHLPVLGDWDFNLRLMMQGDLAQVADTLAFQHVRPESAGEEANTITAKRDLHQAMRTRLINEYVRQDVRSGKPGLGTLLAQADMFEDGLEKISLRAQLRRVLGLKDRAGA